MPATVQEIEIQGSDATTYERLTQSGGKNTTAVAAGASSDTVIKSGADRLCRVLVTATGTNPMQLYDNASAGSGKIIGALPASPSIGAVYDFQLPAASGITVKGNAANPAVTIGWS